MQNFKIWKVVSSRKRNIWFYFPVGTYCQQREVEAITESVEDDTGKGFFLSSCMYLFIHVPVVEFKTNFLF